ALRAALEARRAGARTLVITKGRLGATGTTAFEVASLAGFSVPDGAADPTDTPDVLYEDIMRNGAGCADPRLVRVLADEAPSAAAALAGFGVEFMKAPDGKILVAMGDFASKPRNRKIHGHGRPIVRGLQRACAEAGVVVLEDTVVCDLVRGERGCAGVLAVDLGGGLHAVSAGATILATGGAGQLFEYSLSPPDVTGDGYALAYRAGAELANLEFMQAGFGLIHPFANIIMAWFWLLAPKLTNGSGDEFLNRYLPPAIAAESCFRAKVRHYPFTSEDASRYLEIAAKQEIAAGRGTARGGVFLDLREVNEGERIPPGSDIAAMWPVSKAWFRARGVDVMRQPLDVSIFGHAINGGVRIDEHGQSTLPGLYAAGEASAGPYGADRLGGNMLLNCQVFGARAGRHAAASARRDQPGISAGRRADFASTVASLLGRSGSKTVAQVKRDIQAIMSEHVLVIRSRTGLETCLDRLHAIREEVLPAVAVPTPAELVGLREATSLAEVGALMARAALMRCETRGGHYREDFPERQDAAWAGPIVIRSEDGKPCLRRGCFA
ncbi:MAG TPA: FAD-binding protein, partial [Candidatus Sulfotelmatobacter sp.]|nr:FAD-binding protein [Candidatus Sulfotelmatobacter sp.]